MVKPIFTSTVCQSALKVFIGVAIVLLACPAHAIEDQPESRNIPDQKMTFMNYVDKYHSYLQGQVNQPAVWFDGFFGDPRTEYDELPTSFVRLRTSARYTEGEGFKFPIRLRANIKLPRASRKLRIIIAGENQDELSSASAGDDSTKVTGAEFDGEKSSVGLRYTLYSSLRSVLHFGGGTSSLSPFEYYINAKYRRLIHIGERNTIRLLETGFWNSINGFGETSRVDLERTFANKITGRFSLFGTYSETSKGMNWGVETSFFKHLTTKTAAALDLGAYGITKPYTKTTNYRIASRVRTNKLRPWLFFEIEPSVSFPRPLDEQGQTENQRSTVGAITFMMEIQFASN
jgi:hypothetical protein